MDKMMRQYADCFEEYAGKRFSETPGAGAAGGLGFAFLFGLENGEQMGIRDRDLLLEIKQ